MNKQNLIDAVAEDAGLNKSQAKRAVDAVLGNIENALSCKQDVLLVGFGTFSVRKARERSGRNPQTGETLVIPERNRIVFKAGKSLLEAAN